MKPLSHLLFSTLLAIGVAAPAARAAHWTADFKEGKPAFKSMGPLAFGPEGILFVADTKSAAIVAIATGDTKAAAGAKPLKIEGINQKIAGLLGASAEQLLIDDIAVNPESHSVYLAVSRGRGPDAIPVLVRVTTAGELEVVSLDKVKFSRAELPDAPVEGVVGEGRRSSNPRQESITDIAFLEDRVLVAGLSNEEFASTLRAIPFPFKTVANGTSVEIYHGAHGRFETRAPVRTFVPFKVGTTPSLLAAYTCTPLVQFPLSDLKPGARIKGKTVAELGNQNRPLDMIVYQKGGHDYLLLANSSRGVMKISTDQIEGVESITAPVPGGGKKGLPYETIASWKGVDQLDRIDSEHAVVLRHGEGGSLTLESLPLP
ncbi:MAG TPA: hypothetical protein VFT34_09275 [Verrucomicrobiae bacterium]|nr:hypothetical protein [Verrucomicrobiae bacterium]